MLTETTVETPKFELGVKTDVEDLRRAFSAKRRLHIPDFLAPASADALHDHLLHKVEWSYFFFANKHLWEVPADVRRTYTAEQHREVYELAYASARDGYAFIYETSPRSSPVEGGIVRAKHKDLLRELEVFLNSPRMLEFARRLTGAEDIARVEATATSFKPGQFLAAHDDSAVDTRRAAYVFQMTRAWRIEWGGLLEFIDEKGDIEEAWVPRFNSFHIFAVPQAHAVSCVAPFANGPRIAVSGWFHAAT